MVSKIKSTLVIGEQPGLFVQQSSVIVRKIRIKRAVRQHELYFLTSPNPYKICVRQRGA